MGENGAGNINLGGNSGFNPMAMMAGITLGGVVGQNIANTVQNSMNGNTAVPPPIPKKTYFVAENGQPSGPFDMQALTQLAIVGRLTKESLVWCEGMGNWTKADEVDDLKQVFKHVPPKL